MKQKLIFLSLLGTFFWGLSLFSSECAYSSESPYKVVFISVDGLRHDVVTEDYMPFLSSLLKKSSYTLQAKSLPPTLTLPNHTSMVTGLEPNEHGITFNNYVEEIYEGKTIFRKLKENKLKTAAFFSKDKFVHIIPPEDVDFWYGREKEQGSWFTRANVIAKKFARVWNEEDFALSFIHIREPDEAGHKRSWMSDFYLENVKESDRALKKIYQTIQDSEDASRTFFIVTSDHGGEEKSHWEWEQPKLKNNVLIPWVCFGPEIEAQEVRSQITTASNYQIILDLIKSGRLKSLAPALDEAA